MDDELYTIIDQTLLWWGWAQRRPGVPVTKHPNTAWGHIIWWDCDTQELRMCELATAGDEPCPKNWILV